MVTIAQPLRCKRKCFAVNHVLPLCCEKEHFVVIRVGYHNGVTESTLCSPNILCSRVSCMMLPHIALEVVHVLPEGNNRKHFLVTLV